MQDQNKKDRFSGVTGVRGEQIFWRDNNENILEMDINDIVIIGEYTNSDGPYFDDWFLVFVTFDGLWKRISWYAENIEQVTQYLSARFNQDLNITCLANSIEWKSTILYPEHLRGDPLFTLFPSETYKAQKTFLDKLLYSFGFGNFDTSRNITLTEEVKKELKNAKR